MHWCVGGYLHKSHSAVGRVFKCANYHLHLRHSFGNICCLKCSFFISANSLSLYGFQLPAALFALVRIFFRAVFFALRNTERVGGAVLRSVPHSLSHTHSLSSILSLPSRQYRDCSFLATLILRDANFYLESDSTEEQPFLHDSQGIKKKKEERKGQKILHGYIFSTYSDCVKNHVTAGFATGAFQGNKV